MSLTPLFRTAPIAVVLAATAWTAGPVAQARLPLAIDTARVTIAGTSNIHEYTASTTTVRVTRVQLGRGRRRSDVLERRRQARRARGLRDRHSGGDAVVAEGRPRQEHAQGAQGRASTRTSPSVCSRLEARRAAGALQAVGVLQIAGVEREVALDLKTAAHATPRSSSTATLPLLMTDYGITPPKAMLGMLKTDPKVTVTFETVLAVPLT